MNLSAIRGSVRLLGVIGDPIAQSRASAIINGMLAERGLGHGYAMVPLHVEAKDLGKVIEGLKGMKNFHGTLVTAPHKAAVLAFIDVLSDESRATGSVNIVRRDADGTLHGHTLDGDGFITGLASRGHKIEGARCLLAGAGGAGAAIAHALVRHGCAHLHIINRSESHACALAETLRKRGFAASISTGDVPSQRFDIGINATSLGMRPGDALPLSDTHIKACSLIAECVIAPEVTPLLARAMELERPTHSGKEMLNAQLESFLTYWAPTNE